MPENSKMEWYLGLDVGTNSVGFSATDKEYNILTKSGKLQCGTRLFEDAKDASERRGFRSSRRRLGRRKVRIDLLQELFDAQISAKYSSFFIRLNESNLHSEDKTVKVSYPLFNDKSFTDKDYYKRFPTIYHLRKHLLENDEKDIRLLYLACHHLIKYRGHFLFERFEASGSHSGYAELFSRLKAENFEKLCENKAVANALKGNKIDLIKIFPNDDEIGERISDIKDELKEYKFSSEKFEECQAISSSVLNDDQLSYILTLKTLYDRKRLDEILKGHSGVASAMTARYEEHKADLKLLKTFIKKELPDEYSKMFRFNSDYKDKGFAHASYVNYIGSNMTHGKKTLSHSVICVDKGKEPMTASYEDFLNYTDVVIEKAEGKNGYALLKSKIDNKTLCQIHNTQENSYIPYQLNEAELRSILERQKDNFPFMHVRDEYGSVSDKIVSLLTFRIPYYIGPLSEKDKGKFAWIEKKNGFENKKVYPWNFKQVVDTAASGNNFIEKMTAKCTYLKGEDVIPKQSLLYQRYMLLNDLNNLKINGNRISKELKLFLLNGICQSETSLSKAKIKKFLVDNGKISKSDTVGKENENDTAFNSSMSSLIKFRDILGENIDEEVCESIIKLHTVFGDEKEPVREKLKALYGTKHIEEFSKMTFKGWARFSAKFLSGITATDKNTGETALTIIKILEDTTLNLNEILNSDNYSPKFCETVAKANEFSEIIPLDYEHLVEGLYCSPTVKRSIWQAVLISRELAKINKCPPKKVFIEVTRGEDKSQKGKMKSSRRKQIENLLNIAAKDCQEITKLKQEFDRKTDEKEFRTDRLYLYFTQLGKCMYSGERIKLDELNKESICDIDHIYPQSKIKDDSLTNRVLVKRSENARKGDAYPLAYSIQQKMKPHWSMLKDKELITSEKYDRLTRTQSFTDEQIGGFINRQLVSTNQAVKETANILKLIFGDDAEIVYSKAGNVSEFRQTNSLVKCREVNNLHHAHDAYLNIIVGNVWNSVYTKYWIRNETFNEDRAMDNLFKKDRPGFWKVEYFQKINDYLFDNKKYLNKFPVTFRAYERKGAFFKKTIHPKGKGRYELHKGLPTKDYGGYINTDANEGGCNAYNCLIEYDGRLTKAQIKKGVAPARVRGIFPVPIRFIAGGRYNGEELLRKIAEENEIGDKNPTLIIPRILMFSVLEIDGVRYHMRSGDLQCSVTTEWYPDKEIIGIVHDIFKYMRLVSEKQISKEQHEKDKEMLIDIPFANREKNKKKEESKSISRVNNLKLYDAIIRQVKKPFYDNYGFSKKIKTGKISREKFEQLKTYEQAEQLVSLLNLITMNGTEVKVPKIGGAITEKCKYIVNGNISQKNVSLVTQSVTGLFENKTVINKKEPLL
ncbi:MAG: type II CRISPR RNA-guided endonuclease Cas9 [Clostridiales bacterium]|jgi:CRISPR-associated endonuclease Csn1|nr:type II CRISPR RNA-guided endonuclease Cas9 [Clostridiales bacterium]